MRFLDMIAAPAEAAYAKRHVRLAPEPPGDRFGVVDTSGNPVASAKGCEGETPITVTMVGDSLVAGCGTANTSQSIMAVLASRIAVHTHRPVAWKAIGKLGATVRRVRYRMLDQVTDNPDLLIVCVGSNDIMAGRKTREWVTDLEPVLDDAKRRAKKVILFSSGQPHRSPALGASLKRVIEERINAQTISSARLCKTKGITFLDLTHTDLIDPRRFWASDGFHPSAEGYRIMADAVMRLLFGKS
jgi:lysophospholipase L1-like esterase